MFRSSFFWKLYAGFFVLILLSSVVVGGLLAHRLREDSVSTIRASLQARGLLLKELSRGALRDALPSAELESTLRQLGERTETRYTVIAASGLVLADSHEDPEKMDDHGSRPEVLASRSQPSGSAIRFSNTLRQEMMYLALTVDEDGRTLGYVRTAVPTANVSRQLTRLTWNILMGAAAAALIALILGFFYTRSVVQPLTRMTEVAEAMAAGDYDLKLSKRSRSDEIGKLSVALDRLASSSRERMERIRTNRNKLAAILGGMVEGVIAVDNERRTIHMNQVAGQLLGVSPQESLGKPVWEITRLPEVAQILEQTLEDSSEIKEPLRIASTPRDEFVEMHSSPLFNGEDHIVGAVVVLHDVTELHRLETVRKDFVANVSHELKTPIAAIRGLVETLLDDPQAPADVQLRFLGKIRDQALRLSSIVTDLLTLSRLESREGEGESRLLDLREAVQTSIRALLPTAEEKGLAVHSDIPALAIRVLGDEEALGQMTSNLLDNAIKYTPEKGEIWVQLRSEEGSAVLEVRDTGIGIETREQARIFERFYRVDKARSRELGGTGLGLSIVKHIVRTHRGTIQLESTLGVGSTFRVTIPLAPASV